MADGTVARSSRQHRTICLPISEDSYRRAVDDPAAFRRLLDEGFRATPELFPPGFDRGYELKGDRTSAKRGLPTRRIRLRDGAAYSARPSFLMPYMTARVADVEGPLSLRTFGVPFWAPAHVLGRDSMSWYRPEVGLGRNSVAGSTVRRAELPERLPADEHHQTIDGEKVYIATTVGDGCVLGVEPATAAGAAELTAAYGVFKAEARDVGPEYAPRAVSVDGWASAHQARLALSPLVVLLRRFLRGRLNIRSRGKLSEPFRGLSKRVWESYHASSRRAFAQRLRRLREWARGGEMPAWLREQVEKPCGRSKEYAEAYSHPGGHRTSNMLDRMMRGMNRYFDPASTCTARPSPADSTAGPGPCWRTTPPGIRRSLARTRAGDAPPNASIAIATTTTGSRTRSSPPPSAATGQLPPKIRDGQD
jgi:hypothetical protein